MQSFEGEIFFFWMWTTIEKSPRVAAIYTIWPDIGLTWYYQEIGIPFTFKINSLPHLPNIGKETYKNPLYTLCGVENSECPSTSKFFWNVISNINTRTSLHFFYYSLQFWMKNDCVALPMSNIFKALGILFQSWTFLSGLIIYLLPPDGPKPGWSSCARNSSHVQDRQDQIWGNCTQLDPEVCHGMMPWL